MTDENRFSTRDAWQGAVTWFLIGVLFGAWAASGFPMGVLLSS